MAAPKLHWIVSMVTAITKGVKVSVEVFYNLEYSKPLDSEFVFAYRVTIENKSNATVKLLSRHWFIIDAFNNQREVAGEGVVGQQPILEPDETYQYVSGCHLNTELGKMFGIYTMEKLGSGRKFQVDIPAFFMEASLKLN